MQTPLRSTLALAFAVTTACASSDYALKYKKTVEEDYKAGEHELEDKNYPEAVRYFEHVRSKYPASKYAALAELKLADAKFDQGLFIESAEAYKQFVKLRPTHERLDYAAFRVGLSYWREAPGDFFLFPPSYEKDQAQIRDAAKAFDDFVKVYPQSQYKAEGQALLAKARDRLADHDWYAASFYAKRYHWAAVASRLESLLKNYPGSKHEQAALYRLAEAYLKTEERFRAQQTLQKLIVKHPEGSWRPKAEKLLASIR